MQLKITTHKSTKLIIKSKLRRKYQNYNFIILNIRKINKIVSY